jgi:hypothetical protein
MVMGGIAGAATTCLTCRPALLPWGRAMAGWAAGRFTLPQEGLAGLTGAACWEGKLRLCPPLLPWLMLMTKGFRSAAAGRSGRAFSPSACLPWRSSARASIAQARASASTPNRFLTIATLQTIKIKIWKNPS